MLPQKSKQFSKRIIATNANSGLDKLRADLNEYAWPLIDNAFAAPFDLLCGRLPLVATFSLSGCCVLLLGLNWLHLVNPLTFTALQNHLHAFVMQLYAFYLLTSDQIWFSPLLTALVALPVIVLLGWSKPFEVAFVSLDGDSISCHWQFKVIGSFALTFKKRLLWKDITRVSLIRPSAKTAPEHWSVCLSTESSSMKIRLTGLSDFSDRQRILDALDEFSPHATRDPELLEAFIPAATGSYTELWLQSLSSPPRRDRLKPLLSGVFLQNRKYTVQEQLGAGGQGIAYVATSREADTSVVLKESILPVYLDIDVRKVALERFAREAEMLRQLNHPQIVKLLDFFVEDHRGYLVLEHINGLSLRKLIDNNGRISESRVIELTRQMCEILAYLHSHAPPIVHRDFTPDNLILSEDKVLKLIDFTVAEQSNKLKTATIVGKPAYMPPEQLRGKPCPQSDIYAMGATMYFLLTAKNPEPISSSNPNVDSEDGQRVSDGLAKLIGKSTALKVEDRFHSVAEFLQKLNDLNKVD